jgi:hypothetical protein
MPSSAEKNAIAKSSGEQGMLATGALSIRKPCDECLITTMQAGLEYPNGTSANIDSGSWLHHIVVLARGDDKQDTTCPLFPGERFFSSGNERTPGNMADIQHQSIKTGYHITTKDTLAVRVDLMNLDAFEKIAYLTIDYEFVPGAPQPGWQTTKAVWMDVAGCSDSEAKAPNDAQFMLFSKPWTSKLNGTMLSVGECLFRQRYVRRQANSYQADTFMMVEHKFSHSETILSFAMLKYHMVETQLTSRKVPGV